MIRELTGYETALLIQTGILFVLVCVAKITWPSKWMYITGIFGTAYSVQALAYIMQVWMEATGNI